MAASLLLLTLLSVFCATPTHASTPGVLHSHHRTGLLGYRFHQQMGREEREPAQKQQTPERWFDQKLNHFDPSDTRRWRQRYFTNGPSKSKYLFVSIGGESHISAGACTNTALAYYAKNFNASCVALEHRFYGESHARPDVSTANLRYLSSEQALADLAAFITAMKEEFSAEKVIVFGASYPGNLAAWFRVKYPHLAWAAVASSAPIHAKVDFKEYYEVKAAPLYKYKSGNVCPNAISDAVAKMQSLMKSAGGKVQIRKIFNLCEDMNLDSKQDVAKFYKNLAEGVIDGDVNTVCDTMTNTSLGEPIERYAQFQDYLTTGCNNYSYAKGIEFLLNETYDFIGVRQWVYQECSELGYFITADGDKQPTGGFSVEYFMQQCADIFSPEFTAGAITRAVRNTNINYGGLDYTQNRVVFVNGDADPWHRLSITHSLPNAPTILIPGGHHCQDMLRPQPDDPPAVVKARAEVLNLIGQWLE